MLKTNTFNYYHFYDKIIMVMIMRALITGASTGFGKCFAKKLSNMGYDLILVARDKSKLEELKNDLNTNVEIISMDLSEEENLYKLYYKCKNNIDLLINNAGFGACGEFDKLDLNNELNMIDLNVKAYHILTKLFLKDFVKRDKGQILNVASIAAFEPGPLMATYYATKSYVYNLTMAIYEELRRKKSNVKINVLCPGPSKTKFFERAKVKFSVKEQSAEFVVNRAIEGLFKNKLLIIPGLKMKIAVFSNRFLSRKTMMKIIYLIQERKLK